MNILNLINEYPTSWGILSLIIAFILIYISWKLRQKEKMEVENEKK